MKNSTLTFIFLFSFVLSNFAQKAINVAMMPIKQKTNYNGTVSEKDEFNYSLNNAIANVATKCLAKNKRMRAIDRQNIDAIEEEVNRSTEEGYGFGGIRPGELATADYMMDTKVVSLSIDKAYNKKDGKATSFAGYQVKLNVSMCIIDVETGEKLATRSAPIVSYVKSDVGSATLDAIDNVEIHVEKLIKEAFPLELTHRKMAQKNGKARDIILNGGSDLGLKKGDRLEVFVVDDSGFEKRVGVVRVKALNGPNFCTAIPTQKAKQIFQNAQNKRTQIVFRSAANRGSFWEGLDAFSRGAEGITYAMISEGTMTF